MTAIPLTWLYVPGDRPEVVSRALASGADVVVVDLEDAVAPDRKEYARTATAERLAEPQPVPVHVRINALDGPLATPDLQALEGLPGLSGLRLPKVTAPRRWCGWPRAGPHPVRAPRPARNRPRHRTRLRHRDRPPRPAGHRARRGRPPGRPGGTG